MSTTQSEGFEKFMIIYGITGSVLLLLAFILFIVSMKDSSIGLGIFSVLLFLVGVFFMICLWETYKNKEFCSDPKSTCDTTGYDYVGFWEKKFWEQLI